MEFCVLIGLVGVVTECESRVFKWIIGEREVAGTMSTLSLIQQIDLRVCHYLENNLSKEHTESHASWQAALVS